MATIKSLMGNQLQPSHYMDTRKSQSCKFKVIAKNTNFGIQKKKIQHATHLLKLVDKICKYEMNPASIVKDTEQT